MDLSNDMTSSSSMAASASFVMSGPPKRAMIAEASRSPRPMVMGQDLEVRKPNMPCICSIPGCTGCAWIRNPGRRKARMPVCRAMAMPKTRPAAVQVEPRATTMPSGSGTSLRMICSASSRAAPACPKMPRGLFPPGIITHDEVPSSRSRGSSLSAERMRPQPVPKPACGPGTEMEERKFSVLSISGSSGSGVRPSTVSAGRGRNAACVFVANTWLEPPEPKVRSFVLRPSLPESSACASHDASWYCNVRTLLPPYRAEERSSRFTQNSTSSCRSGSEQVNRCTGVGKSPNCRHASLPRRTGKARQRGLADSSSCSDCLLVGGKGVTLAYRRSNMSRRNATPPTKPAAIARLAQRRMTAQGILLLKLATVLVSSRAPCKTAVPAIKYDIHRITHD
mmetsp:Transcript_78294/g.229445  ORF Transcript_78294/g.229445 Transcript_78294/m.229445 type:complete len:395 (+) Transcript_78294:393-1577(+)